MPPSGGDPPSHPAMSSLSPSEERFNEVSPARLSKLRPQVIAGVTGNLAIDCALLTRRQARTLVASWIGQGDLYIAVFVLSELRFEGSASECAIREIT
jgi:hypothetical protein